MTTGAIANIGSSGRRQRRILGAAALAIGAVACLVLSRAGMPHWWRLGLAPFWWLAAIGFFQAQASTCVALAAKGVCDAEIGRPLDESEIRTLNRQARRVNIRSAIATAALTVVALALP